MTWMRGTMMRLRRSPCAGSTVVVLAVAPAGSAEPRDGGADVPAAQPKSRVAPLRRQAADILAFVIPRAMDLALGPELAHPEADGVLSGLQRRAHVLLGPVQCIRGPFLHGLELLHGLVTNVPGFVVGVCAKILAPEPHGETPGDRAHDEIDHRRPPCVRELTACEAQRSTRGATRPGASRPIAMSPYGFLTDFRQQETCLRPAGSPERIFSVDLGISDPGRPAPMPRTFPVRLSCSRTKKKLPGFDVSSNSAWRRPFHRRRGTQMPAWPLRR